MASNHLSRVVTHVRMALLIVLLVSSAGLSFAGTQKTNLSDQSEPSEPSIEMTAQDNRDPFEKFNRGIFTINDTLDRFILKPVAVLYNKIIPRPLNLGIHNFFNNLNTVTTIADDILQFEFYQMANDMWRLGINTTIGIGGLFDVASRIGLPYYQNDFGLTMAKWGWKNSIYIVLPFFGPNTFRDGLGLPVDYFGFSIYPYIHPRWTRYELYAVGIVDSRAQRLKFQSVMEEASFDKYVFLRNAYMQHRNYQIEKNSHRGYKEQLKGNNKVQEVAYNYD